VLALAVAAMVFLTVRFDLWGIRSAFIGAVSSLDPEYVSAIEQKRINARDAADLDRRGAELDEREAGIAEEEERLRALGEELDEREKALASAAPPSTSGSGRPQGGYRTSLGAQETEDMMSLARTYAAMDPVAAAEIMANLYSVNDMAVILYYMTEKRAAPILEAMERELAASVTEVLLAEAGRVFN
jgi:flagellar motility protein MotE (MotC chaperone)